MTATTTPPTQNILFRGLWRVSLNEMQKGIYRKSEQRSLVLPEDFFETRVLQQSAYCMGYFLRLRQKKRKERISTGDFFGMQCQ